LKLGIMADHKSVDSLEQGNEGLSYAVLNSPDPHIRRYSVLLLGSEQDPNNIDILVKALSDRDKGVREQAAKALGEVGKPAVPRLTMLNNHADWKVRYRAAEALGMIPETDSLSALVQFLDDEKDHVRYMAAKSLGKLRAIEAVEPLIRSLKDENEFVRKVAAESLGAIGGDPAKKALEEAEIRERSPRVIAAIRNARERV
jgi:HEAT repeat protein